MARYEYKVVPAPTRPAKVKGVKGTEQKFAVALSEIMNELAGDGWEYLRTDTLPCEERQGLTGRTTTFQNMLVFRRAAGGAAEAVAAPHGEAVLAAPAFRATAPAVLGSEGRAPRLVAVGEDGSAPALGAAERDGPAA
jgi:hypothetical protein